MKFKKPKFWDIKKPNIYSYILLPIAFLIQVFAYFKKKRKLMILKSRQSVLEIFMWWYWKNLFMY